MRCYIVEAAEQSNENSPSKRSLELGRLPSLTDLQTDSCIPATLETITKDPHYGFSVAYMVEGETVTKQCTKAIALVIATKPTVSDNMKGGYQMTTEGVQDPFEEDFTCQLFSSCTVTTSPDYQLKRNHGQKVKKKKETQMVVVSLLTC